jgi:ribosomal protein L21E
MKRSHGGISKRGRNVKARKTPINRLLQQFAEGQKVLISFNPSFLKGRPNSLRFNNRFGVVVKKQGGSFKIEFKDGNKTKTLVIANVHLKKA